MKPRNIVIVNQSTGYLTVDICNAFAEEYDNVYLLAGSVSTMERQLSDKVKVISITRYDKRGLLRRLRTWARGAKDIDRFLDGLDEPADVLYFSNPPMSYLKADRREGRFGIVEYDIYPDVLRNVYCPEFIINRWARRKREVLAKASGIITLGDSMRTQLGAYCDESDVTVIHNWSGHEGSAEIVDDSDNEFAQAMGLTGKFVVMYSGNIGLTHNVEALIDIADRLRDDDDIRFLIIGTGGRKDELKHQVKQRKLHNVVFHNFLPAEKIKYSFSSADLGVVTLNEKTARSSVPSKTYNLLSYGIPLLNIAPEHSELGDLIKKYDCGSSFTADDIEGMAEFIRRCKSDRQYIDRLKANASRASEEFTVANARLYTKIFK